MAKQVTFIGEREGEQISARMLITALEKALAWLRGRDENEAIDWEVIRVAIGDPVKMTFRSKSANGEISDRMAGLHSLQGKSLPKVMPRLSDDDIESTADLAAMLGHGFSSFSISSKQEPTVKLTPTLVKRVEELAKTTSRFYYEWTTVRGVLFEVTAVIAGIHRFRIDTTSGDKIPCGFSPEQMPQVKDAIKHMAEIYGRAKCSSNGEIKSIEVKTLRTIPENPTKFGDMPAIDITGGIGAFAHIERIRGGY